MGDKGGESGVKNLSGRSLSQQRLTRLQALMAAQYMKARETLRRSKYAD